MKLAILIILPFLNNAAYTASKKILSTEQDTELWLPESIPYTVCPAFPHSPLPTPNIIQNINLIPRKIMSICH